MDMENKEEKLKSRLEQIKELEEEVIRKETDYKKKENAKKQVLLRLAPSLWKDIAQWADDDFRSINGQIEYILSEATRKHYKK